MTEKKNVPNFQMSLLEYFTTFSIQREVYKLLKAYLFDDNIEIRKLL